MSVEEMRARVAGRVRQAIADSNIAWSTAQRGQLEALVEHITDNVLLEFDALLGHMAPGQAAGVLPTQPPANAPGPVGGLAAGGPAATPGAGDEEQVLWEGRPFLSIGERYIITSERLRIVTGVVGKDHEDVELVRVKDVDHTQGISERILNIGDIAVRTADASRPNVVLRNVTNPEQVHEILRRAVLNARRKYPFVFEQEM